MKYIWDNIIIIIIIIINNNNVFCFYFPAAGPSEISLEQTAGWPHLLAVAFTVTCVLVLLGCLSCCKQRAGFKVRHIINDVKSINIYR